MHVTDAQKIARLTQELAESRKEIEALQRKLDRVRAAVQMPTVRPMPRICDCGGKIYKDATSCYKCAAGLRSVDLCALCCKIRLNKRTQARGVCTKCWGAGLRKPVPINQ